MRTNPWMNAHVSYWDHLPGVNDVWANSKSWRGVARSTREATKRAQQASSAAGGDSPVIRVRTVVLTRRKHSLA